MSCLNDHHTPTTLHLVDAILYLVFQVITGNKAHKQGEMKWQKSPAFMSK